MPDNGDSVPYNAERPAVRAGRSTGALWCCLWMRMANPHSTAQGGRKMPRTFNDLGPLQQKFMLRAFNEGVALDDDLATDKRISSLAGLIVRRTSKKGRTSWRLTDDGRGLVMQHTPVFLHRRGFPSYTHHAWQAVFAEPEVIDAAA